MSILYAVRCNFRDPDHEPDWNAWYSGPKLAAMLAKPMFLRAQRFRAAALDTGVRYLALWLLESAAALDTPQYTGDWGWGRWRPMIDDWSRDLVENRHGTPPPHLPVAASGALHLAWFENGAAAAEAENRAAATRARWWFGDCVGLDRSAALVGVGVHQRRAGQVASRVYDGLAVRETLYHPIPPAAVRRGGEVGGDAHV